MALIIYPDENYDSFCSVTDADSILTNNMPSSQRTAWEALLEADKEIYLRQATILIKQKITLPDTLEDDLKTACAYLANYSIGIDMTNSTSDNNIKVDEVVGVVKTEYFSPNKSSNSFPSIVNSLLKQYGLQSGGSFKFVSAI